MGILIDNISKQFGQFQALHNIHLELVQGELAALLGPSGCGKSTLLRVIAGLESATSGHIYFDDRQVTSLSAKQRDIGFVFQHFALFHHMTVANNVAFGLRMQPSAIRADEQTIQQRVKTLLELVQLETLAYRYPDQLSGGQRQRVALARALATKPKVLLLDEPFSALDAKVRKQLRRWLRDFHHELNVTTLFVTHDQEEALEVADKIILMNKGQIEQIGSPEQVYKQPKTAFVAHFLGDVNLLHGYIEHNQLHLDHFTQDISQQGSWSEQAVVAYVRPHEINLSKNRDANALVGKIIRLHTAGPTVFIEVAIDNQPKNIYISISYTQHQSEQFALGDTVHLKPMLVNIFMQDQLIEFMI